MFPVPCFDPHLTTLHEGSEYVDTIPRSDVVLSGSVDGSRYLLVESHRTGEHWRIPLAQAADGSMDADGTLYFTRFDFQGSHTKRYRGGTAQSIWKHVEGVAEAVPLA